jgi:hypothetical protein
MKKIILSFLLGIILVAKAQVPGYVPSNGLVGWWPFTGNAIDSSGTGNNGSVTGAVLTSDRFGRSNQAYSFDGNADYINCGNASSLNISGSITISAWIYANNFNTDHGIVSKWNTSPSYDLVTNSPFSIAPLNKLRWLEAGGFLFSNAISASTWYHVVTVFDVANQKKYIYINGNLAVQSSVSLTAIPTNSNNLYIGAHQPSNVSYWSWDGKLDDIAIWDRALDSNEIKNVFNGCNDKITQQPSDLSTSNRIASFSCQGNDTLQSYQWQVFQNGAWTNLKDSAQFSGSKTSNLIIKQLLSKNNGQKFRCQVKGKCLNDVSKTATLNYNCLGTITQQPISQGMFNGQARFTCKSNDTLVSYQWQSNIGMGWNNLSNAGQYTGVNSDTIKVSNVTSSNNNQLFRCVIKGDCLTDTTDEASLKVWGVGINELDKNAISVYPNPAGEVIKFNLNTSFHVAIVKIYDASGKLVLMQNILSSDAAQIKVSELSKGVYNIYLSVDGKQFTSGFNKE